MATDLDIVRWPARTVALARDVWLFVAGRNAVTAREELEALLGPDATPSVRTIRRWAADHDWPAYGERTVAAAMPALMQATRDLAAVNAPAVMLRLVAIARGDLEATRGQVAAASLLLRPILSQPEPDTQPMNPHAATATSPALASMSDAELDAMLEHDD